MDKARDKLIQKADSDYEVHWGDIIKASRVPAVDRTTAAKSMANAGYDVKFRKPRVKPYRADGDEAERKRICNKLRKFPDRHWQHNIAMYIDNTCWKQTTTNKSEEAKTSLKNPHLMGRAPT